MNNRKTLLIATLSVLSIALVIIAVPFMVSLALAEPTEDSSQNTSSQNQTSLQNVVDNSTPTNNDSTMTNELKIEDVVVGSGQEAVAGRKITVHYTGTFTDGEVFDSSRERNQPFSFVLGSGQVIQGWEQGFTGMKVGGQRKLTIPPDLAYGDQDYSGIPGGSTLLFDVELLAVE